VKFASPQTLNYLILVPFFVALFFLFNKIALKRLERFSGTTNPTLLLTSSLGRKRELKLIFFLLTLSALIVALARPQWGEKEVKLKRVGIDIIIALDSSLSMAAEDVAPNRFAKAKKEVKRIAEAFAGNRLGLITFAGESAVESPLTLDVSTFKLFLQSTSLNSIPVGGTDIAKAIRKATASFYASRAKSKAIILITDGEDNEGGGLAATKEAYKKGINIYTVGFGSTEGVPIPLRNERGELLQYKKDAEGKTVLTSQDGETLKKIATAGGGVFVSANGGHLDIKPIIDSLESLEKSDISDERIKELYDRFEWFIGLAVSFLFIGWLV